ncbi:MAG: hypothetical protein IKX88_11180, partial [Thermoguttaceae bacterium]|nr:hypothetical protein [Thermoguttaceae bacterium]
MDAFFEEYDESEMEDDPCSAATLVALTKKRISVSSVQSVLTERSDKAEDERPEIEAPKQAPRVRGNSSNNGCASNRRARGDSSWLRRCALIFGLLCVVFATLQICADSRPTARPNYFVSNNVTDAAKPNEHIIEREFDLPNTVADRALEVSSEDIDETILFDDNDELPTNEPTIAERIREELKSKAIEIKETAYQKTYVERPVAIEKIKIGDRTAGVNPQGAEPCDENRLAEEPHLVYSLKLPKEDGSFCDIQILRPANWLDSTPIRLCNAKTREPLTNLDYILAEMNPISCHIDAVAEVWLDLPEMGCVGWAQLTEVSYDFEYRPGEGNLVTGIFQHEVSEAVNLYVEGQDEPIGVTETHPFWSVDQQDFVPVSELREGERLLVPNGETKRVVQKLPRPGPEKVYNLEIFGEHVYRVSEDGVLVHNSRACGIEVDIITKQIPGLRKVNGCLVFVFEERPDIPIIMGSKKNDSDLLYDNGLTKSFNTLKFEAHHIPSNLFNKTIGRLSYDEGIAISLPHDAHALTSTYGKHVCNATSALS